MKTLKLDKEERKEIISYMMMFYGKNEGIYAIAFENKLTAAIIDAYLDEFITLYNSIQEYDGFDTPQREFFRDWLLLTVFNTAIEDLEYSTLMEKMRKSQRNEYITLGKFMGGI